MHFVIVGCGRVGSSLAAELSRASHTVGIIDKRSAAFARLPQAFPGDRVVGFGFDRDRLIDAGIERADALAAVTSGDNSNIVVARIAKETFGVRRVMARIYDPGRALLYERLGIPTVATVEWTTDQALRRLLPDETRAEWFDATGGVAVVERRLPDDWAGRELNEIDEPGKWRLAALTRAGKALIPTGRLVAQEGDVVVVSVAGDFLDALDERLTAKSGAH